MQAVWLTICSRISEKTKLHNWSGWLECIWVHCRSEKHYCARIFMSLVKCFVKSLGLKFWLQICCKHLTFEYLTHFHAEHLNLDGLGTS